MSKPVHRKQDYADENFLEDWTLQMGKIKKSVEEICDSLTSAGNCLEENRKVGKDEEERYSVRQIARQIDRACAGIQNLSVEVRNAPMIVNDPDETRSPKEILVNSYGIDISLTPEKWIKIKMPPIIRKKNAIGNQWAIREPIMFALQKFQRRCISDGTGYVKYEDCTVVFVHCYDRKKPWYSMRDNDNYEINSITDEITTSIMTGDSASLCSYFITTRADESDFTEIYVMPKKVSRDGQINALICKTLFQIQAKKLL